MSSAMHANPPHAHMPADRQNKNVQKIPSANRDRCSECGGDVVHDYDSGEIACGECGLVVSDEIIDRGPEWRGFTLEEKERRSRMGMPDSLLYYPNKGTTFRPTEGPNPQQTYRWRRQNIRARYDEPNARNLAKANNEIVRLSNKLNIPEPVREQGALIYRKALKKGLVRGRSIKSIAAASLYAACRMKKIPRSLDKLAEESPRDKKDIARCYRMMVWELEFDMPVQDAKRRVSKIASGLDVGIESQKRAYKILEEARKLRITAGKDPMGMAATALYMACKEMDEDRTQKEVAEAAGVTEVTIRNRMRDLKESPIYEILKEYNM